MMTREGRERADGEVATVIHLCGSTSHVRAGDVWPGYRERGHLLEEPGRQARFSLRGWVEVSTPSSR